MSSQHCFAIVLIDLGKEKKRRGGGSEGKDQILSLSARDFKYSLAEIIHSFIKNSPKLHFPRKDGNDQKMRMLLVLEQMKTK